VPPAAAPARRGDGPSLIVADTYRYEGHNVGDGQRYRSRDEVEQWRQSDPIERFREVVERQGVLAASDADALHQACVAELDAAIAFAEQSPEPEPQTLEDDVYA
jgi:TPP-dependent pyruvate/acetoin dehydrogenase alpha subunit